MSKQLKYICQRLLRACLHAYAAKLTGMPKPLFGKSAADKP